MRRTTSRTAAGVSVACTLLAACAGGNATTTLGDGSATTPVSGRDAGADTTAASRDATSVNFDAPLAADGQAHDATLTSDTGTGDAAGGAHDAAGAHEATTDGAGHAGGDAGDATGHSDAMADAAADGHSDAPHDAQGDGHAEASIDAGVDSGSSGPATFLAGCAGTSTVLTGTVLAPNGTDPIPSVRVYAAESINPYPTAYCDKCAAPVDPAYVATNSAADGTFSLNLDNVPAGATIDLAIQIGRFRKHTTIPVTACQTKAVPVAAATLPGKSADGDIPKIVVGSGEADHLDVVLNALGITEYDCYEGRKTAGSSTATCQQPAGQTIADVIASATTLGGYHMAFLSCAPGAYAQFITNHSQATMDANTRSWVAAGGRIFVTDMAYDYIAQAFPTGIEWAGPTATAGTPQPVDGANLGCAPGGSAGHATEYSATIDDPSLASWLKGRGVATGTNPTLANIQGYYQPWATIASLPPSTRLIVDGTMPIDPTYPTTACASPTLKDVPLTTEFDVPTCGRVVFSSFHTYAGSGASSSAANQKIMEYLIFAAAVCSG